MSIRKLIFVSAMVNSTTLEFRTYLKHIYCLEAYTFQQRSSFSKKGKEGRIEEIKWILKLETYFNF